jgi:hypothetical protein
MLRKLCLISGVIVMIACQNSSEKSVKNDHYLEPKGRLKNIIDSFVQVAGNKSPVYEIYVVKLSPFEANIILYCGDSSLTRLENRVQGQVPLEKAQSMGVTFDVYSGCERYFNRRGTPGRKKEVTNDYQGNAPAHTMWAIKDSFDVIRVFPSDIAYPWIGIPDPIPDSIMQMFTPPVVK